MRLSPAGASSHRFSRLKAATLLIAVCALTSSCTEDGRPIDWKPERPSIVRGIADYHNHQFAHLGFAEALHTHSTNPSDTCRPVLAFDPGTFQLRDLVRQGLLKEAKAQAEDGRCYPTASNLAGQQVDEASLFRAYQYGLRLMVMHALNSEFLCVSLGIPVRPCRDVRNLERQLQEAMAMERRIDEAAGGPGQGWYQVVETPAEAREVIAGGKLAVVLGIEAAGAFDCGIQEAGPVEGVPPLVGSNTEMSYVSGQCDEYGIGGFNTHRALARMERYWDLGARHFFPIHTFDNVVGGTALSNPLLHAIKNPSGMVPGNTIFDRVPAIDATILRARPPISSFRCNAMEFDVHRCNAQGLSALGKSLVEHMASYGAMIDIDHMSLQAKKQVMNLLGAQYSLISSHTGAYAINHLVKSNEGQLTDDQLAHLAAWDGAVAPILRPANHLDEMDTFPPGTSPRHTCAGTSESFIQTYRFVVDKIRNTSSQYAGLFDPEPTRFVGVGFGSDFNGLAGWPIGRFWGDTVVATGGNAVALAFAGEGSAPPHPCVGGFDPARDSTQTAKVAYPITSPMTGASFDRSVLPWSGMVSTYDISYAGFAHIGMLPDFMAELEALGLTAQELEPMWLGAEAYLRAWAHTAGWGPSYGDGEVAKGIRTQCRGVRAQLLVATYPEQPSKTDIERWSEAVSELNRLGCAATTPKP